MLRSKIWIGALMILPQLAFANTPGRVEVPVKSSQKAKKTGPRVKVIEEAKLELTDEVMKPKPADVENENWRTAANMVIIPNHGIKETVVQEMGAYGSHQFKKVKITGLGPSGEYRADFVGSVSSHDMKHLDQNSFKAAIDRRVSMDGVKIVLENSAGKQEIVVNHPSDLVTHIPVVIKFAPGANKLTYYRTDRNSGRIVSVIGGYDEGRVEEYNWDGK